MMDTNQISQAVQDAALVKTQVSANWPAICAAAVIVARELRNFNLWCLAVAEFVMRHGGILYLFCKLFWNPPTQKFTQGPAI